MNNSISLLSRISRILSHGSSMGTFCGHQFATKDTNHRKNGIETHIDVLPFQRK